jgi:hypothetical protein
MSFPSEGTDLIYEGITTFLCVHVVLLSRSVEGTDLIYEGITTEGITTLHPIKVNSGKELT